MFVKATNGTQSELTRSAFLVIAVKKMSVALTKAQV